MITTRTWNRTSVAGLAALVLLATTAGAWADDKASKDPKQAAKPAKQEVKQDGQTIEMKVTDKGFEPAAVTVTKGQPVTLVITRLTEKTCAHEIVIDGYGVNAKLPLNTPVKVTFTPNKAGALQYGCAMGKMVGGVMTVR